MLFDPANVHVDADPARGVVELAEHRAGLARVLALLLRRDAEPRGEVMTLVVFGGLGDQRHDRVVFAPEPLSGARQVLFGAHGAAVGDRAVIGFSFALLTFLVRTCPRVISRGMVGWGQPTRDQHVGMWSRCAVHAHHWQYDSPATAQP